MQKGEPTWEELRQFGAGWWIDNINILKRTMEKVGGKRCQPMTMFFNTKQLNYTVNLEIFTKILEAIGTRGKANVNKTLMKIFHYNTKM